MTIRINLPGGVVIETDTLTEAVSVARALSPTVLGGLEQVAEPAPARTRVLTTNRDLEVLATWGLDQEEMRATLTPSDWVALTKELGGGRSVASAQTLARRFSWGVYEASSEDPSDFVTVHLDKDRSRKQNDA